MPGMLVKLLSTKMGNTKSKNKTKGHRSKHNRNQKKDSLSDTESDGKSLDKDFKKEDPEISRLKNNIKNNPEGFILNNLMMCVEFFKNYDEDISRMRETLVSPRETTLNKRLLPQKRILLPDVLQEQISRNVKFISRRETVDPTVEPLQPVRMFVVYENIEVSDQYDSSQYSTTNDTITYNMRLKPSKHKGYIHLQRMGVTPLKSNPITEEEEDLSSIAEDEHEPFSDGENFYNSTQGSSKHYNSSDLRPPSNVVSPKLTISKSMPDITENEYAATNIYERLPADRNKLPLESSNDNKDDTDYGSISESKSIQRQSSVSKRDAASLRRGIPRNAGPLSRIKIRSTSASPASSTSSGYKSGNCDSDSEYGYSTVKSYSKSKPLDASEMPEWCFSQVTFTPDDRIYDPVEDRKKQIISSKERRVQVERNRRNYDVWYLNSSRFKKRFYNVFLESLILPLDLEDAIRYRRPQYFKSVIYCDKVEVNTTAKCNISESYEIIPCVWTQWPECANEWLERTRDCWPSYKTICHVKKSGCYIIPQEFGTKEENSNYKTEWQLTFPAAERYLETCMNHAQMRVYIIVLMLHKTFIRAVESAPDRLNTHQIRNQLFWLLEMSRNEWIENKTGDYLVKLLNCLCNCINQDDASLKDYFQPDKNLLKSSEKGSLFFSLKQLKRILGNPVMYVLHAMENIRYKSEFFPKLNYEELLKILTAEELLLINPNLEKKVSNIALRQEHLDDDETYNERRGFWDDAKKKKEQFSTYSKKPVINKTLINPSRAHDSVVDIAIRCGELKGIRLSKLLNFFIEHLIKMTKKYQEYGALHQKNDYLHHAMSLCVLLAEDKDFKTEVKDHIQELSALEKLTIHSRSQNEPPETPKRNVEINNFSSAFKGISSTTSSVHFPNNEVSTSFQARAHGSSSRNSSPQMKKKSDPPVYLRALKDRFSVTCTEDSITLPVSEKIEEDDDISQSVEKTKQKKKGSRESIIISLTNEDEAEDEELAHDTYI